MTFRSSSDTLIYFPLAFGNAMVTPLGLPTQVGFYRFAQKRVASAVGEGSMTVRLVHQYLADTGV